MSPLLEATKEENRENHVLESVFFSWFAHTGLYVTPVGGRKEEKKKKGKKHTL